MPVKTRKTAFTLVEVILAVGILGMSVLAIIAFLGSVGQSTSEVMNQAVASRIADNVRAELAREDIDALYGWVSAGSTGSTQAPLELMATSDGERVRLAHPATASNVDNHPETGNPPGIALADRYFKIEVWPLQRSLLVPTSTGQFQNDSAMLPVSVQVIWPHQVKTGPNTSTTAPAHQQSRYVFNTVILRKQ